MSFIHSTIRATIVCLNIILSKPKFLRKAITRVTVNRVEYYKYIFHRHFNQSSNTITETSPNLILALLLTTSRKNYDYGCNADWYPVFSHTYINQSNSIIHVISFFPLISLSLPLSRDSVVHGNIKHDPLSIHKSLMSDVMFAISQSHHFQRVFPPLSNKPSQNNPIRTHTNVCSRSRNVSRKNDPLGFPDTPFFPRPQYPHTALIKKYTK